MPITRTVEVLDVYMYPDRSKMKVTIKFDFGGNLIIEIPLDKAPWEALDMIRKFYYNYDPNRVELHQIIKSGYKWSWIE